MQPLYSKGKVLVLPLLCLLITLSANGQYFGRNKVNYHDFNFKVLHTPHFDIYSYIPDTAIQKRFAQQTEQWYRKHQAVLRDTFRSPNPFILYNAHGHFQQTRAISGLIDVGTGGVTEALKNRVIMPFMESRAQTDHVLGHELVHAFQYALLGKVDSVSFPTAISNSPLWMVEGLAEYMSIGYQDAHTALWLRNAVLNNKLPSLKDLTNRPDLYFPYRWGHAFWAYVTGIWGDQIIRPLFMQTARHGYKEAVKRVLGLDEKVFSEKWKESLRNHYGAYQKDTDVKAPGIALIDRDNGGRMNIVPSISPDGKWIAFWTEKELFSIDLCLADAATGRIVRKFTSGRFESHIDNYSSYESAIAWSPDSRRIAYVAFAKGNNQLIIEDIENKKYREEIDLPGLDGFSNPAWSPDGQYIVVTGLVNGQSDLYAYHFNTKQLTALTNDIYSDLQPSFSSDGKWIVFSTDRGDNGHKAAGSRYEHRIALMDVKTRQVRTLDLFPGTNNFNPVLAPGDSIIYFLSDRNGFRDLYSYHLNGGGIVQHTRLFTGITGITINSPAFSISRGGRLVYSYFNDNNYIIYSIDSRGLKKDRVNEKQAGALAAMLPPVHRTGQDIVQLNKNKSFPLVPDTSLTIAPYKPRLQLDYLSNTGVGVSTGRYGTGLAGGINSMFSDMLGNHQLFGAISLNGQLKDAAGQFVYYNQKKRINWGVGYSHIPYYSGSVWLGYDSINIGEKKEQVLTYNTDILRTFEDQISILAAYPFSQTRRVEFGGSYSIYYNNLERFTEYYDSTGLFLLGYDHKKNLPAPEGFKAGNVYGALVGDNSQFGVASPLTGHRYRLEAGRYFGSVNANQLLADYRRYFRVAPVTIAARSMFYGQFGKDVNNGMLPSLYLGYPWLIRGYEGADFTTRAKSSSLTINDLLGSNMYVANAELRLPFSGPERLSLIKSRFFFTELALFTDAGAAWGWANGIKKDPKWIVSSGLSMRINLFGYLIIEPFYAIPWNNGGFRNGSFGLNLLPGW